MTDKVLIDRAVLEQALKALEKADRINGYRNNWAEVNSLIAALKQPQVEQEPYIWYCPDNGWVWTVEAVVYRGDTDGMIPLYTHQQPPRHPLTNEELLHACSKLPNWGFDMDSLPQGLEQFARAIERAHGIKEKK